MVDWRPRRRKDKLAGSVASSSKRRKFMSRIRNDHNRRRRARWTWNHEREEDEESVNSDSHEERRRVEELAESIVASKLAVTATTETPTKKTATIVTSEPLSDTDDTEDEFTAAEISRSRPIPKIINDSGVDQTVLRTVDSGAAKTTPVSSSFLIESANGRWSIRVNGQIDDAAIEILAKLLRSQAGDTAKSDSTSTFVESGSKASHDGRIDDGAKNNVVQTEKDETNETTNTKNDLFSEVHWKTKIDRWIDDRMTEILRNDRERRRKDEEDERARWMRTEESHLRGGLQDQIMLVERVRRTMSREKKENKTKTTTRSEDDDKETKSILFQDTRSKSPMIVHQCDEDEDRDDNEGKTTPTYTESHPDIFSRHKGQKKATSRETRRLIGGTTTNMDDENSRSIDDDSESIDSESIDSESDPDDSESDPDNSESDPDDSDSDSDSDYDSYDSFSLLLKTCPHLVRLSAAHRDLLLLPDDYASHSLLMSEVVAWTLSQS